MSDVMSRVTLVRRHLVQSLVRLLAVLCAALAPLPVLVRTVASIVQGDLYPIRSPISYLRYNCEEQVAFLVVALLLGGGLWLSQRSLAYLIVPRVRPECPECGYALRNLTSSRCPECGIELPGELRPPPDPDEAS